MGINTEWGAELRACIRLVIREAMTHALDIGYGKGFEQGYEKGNGKGFLDLWDKDSDNEKDEGTNDVGDAGAENDGYE